MPANENLGEQFSTCQSAVQRPDPKTMRRGTQTYGTTPGVCGRPTAEGSDMCAMHITAAAKMQDKLAAKRAREGR